MNEITIIIMDSVDNVTSLDQRSKEISKLIIGIQDVAEQTNIIALNVAIEAARVGWYYVKCFIIT